MMIMHYYFINAGQLLFGKIIVYNSNNKLQSDEL